ncbi:hypothetical protein [Pectinatus brassicae]|uniref:Uncharacterized protein n=1 Tax=Pectinatus brassicae TaxID=862415 RepID=A0A840UP09_9FIRM|nr:hypothetical protein [Pectinatus brassicae]MBB5337667.1 hypothetical protein [Pectinatus brassicae]
MWINTGRAVYTQVNWDNHKKTVDKKKNILTAVIRLYRVEKNTYINILNYKKIA